MCVPYQMRPEPPPKSPRPHLPSNRPGRDADSYREPPRPSPRRWLRSKVASAAGLSPMACEGRERFPAYRPYYRAFLLQKGSRLKRPATGRTCAPLNPSGTVRPESSRPPHQCRPVFRHCGRFLPNPLGGKNQIPKNSRKIHTIGETLLRTRHQTAAIRVVSCRLPIAMSVSAAPGRGLSLLVWGFHQRVCPLVRELGVLLNVPKGTGHSTTPLIPVRESRTGDRPLS